MKRISFTLRSPLHDEALRDFESLVEDGASTSQVALTLILEALSARRTSDAPVTHQCATRDTNQENSDSNSKLDLEFSESDFDF
jgi:hypothetical protein